MAAEPIPPIKFSLTNILRFFSFMSPFLITFCILLISILANNITKGLIFLIGITIITFLTYLLKNTLKSKQSELASPFCNILPFPFTTNYGTDGIYNSPSLSTTIIAFTAAYLIFPMQMNKHSNPMLIAFLIGILGVNASIEVSDKCTPYSGVVLGALVGMIFGILYYSMLEASGNRDLAYFTEVISNNTQCSRPGQNKFKCAVYKNGVEMTEFSNANNVGGNNDVPTVATPSNYEIEYKDTFLVDSTPSSIKKVPNQENQKYLIPIPGHFEKYLDFSGLDVNDLSSSWFNQLPDDVAKNQVIYRADIISKIVGCEDSVKSLYNDNFPLNVKNPGTYLTQCLSGGDPMNPMNPKVVAVKLEKQADNGKKYVAIPTDITEAEINSNLDLSVCNILSQYLGCDTCEPNKTKLSGIISNSQIISKNLYELKTPASGNKKQLLVAKCPNTAIDNTSVGDFISIDQWKKIPNPNNISLGSYLQSADRPLSNS